MKDVIDRDLNLRDVVACRRSGGKEMVIGELLRFGKKQITVEYKWRNNYATVHHYPKDVCKISGSGFKNVINALIETYQQSVDAHDTSKYWTDAEYERAESRVETLKDVIEDLRKIIA